MKSRKIRFIGVFVAVCFVSFAFLAGLLSTMSVVQAAPCSDNILRVKKDAFGAADGCSWDDAFPDLQLALAAAESGDQIWVVSGVYTPGLMVTDTFDIPSAVQVYGGFVGSETELDQRDWQANPTVLSGDIGGDDIVDENGVVLTTTNIIGDNAYHVVVFDGTTIPITQITKFDGFTITAGDYHGFDNGGGGVLCNGNGAGSDCSPELENLHFSGNHSTRWGGAMYIDGSNGGNSNLLLTNALLSHNHTNDDGGGIANWAYMGTSNPKLMTVTFRSNATGGGNDNSIGGGMSNNEGSPILINILFEGNFSKYGGGMINGGGRPILTDVTFISNTATIDGGGMLNDSGSNPKLYDVKFIRNRAVHHGGGMFNYFYADPIMEDVLFLENVVTDGLGGGLGNLSGSDPVITDAVFIGNTAVSGGGLYNFDNRVILTNATFWGNEATYGGGGIHNDENHITLKNVAIGGNLTQRNGAGIFNYRGSVDLNNVTVSGNRAGESGGGMFSREVSNVSVNNGIFWNNQDSSGVGTITATSTITENSVVTLTNSLVQGSGGSDNWQALFHIDGGGNLDADPIFIGPIDLSSVPTTTGNLRLQFDSPAIDAGNNALIPDGITMDLDGNTRIVNGIVDTGAYETNYVSYSLTVQLEGTGGGLVTSFPAGIDCGVTCTAVFEENEVVTLTAVADTNAKFIGWSGAGCAGEDACVVTLTHSQLVTATFEPYYILFLPSISKGD